MDVQTDFVNRYLTKQRDLIHELIGLKLQAEVQLEIEQATSKELRLQLEQVVKENDNLKHEVELLTRPDPENTF